MKRRRIQLSYPKKVRGFRKNPFNKVRIPSLKEDILKKPNRIFFVFLFSLLFLCIAILIYNLQNFIPRIKLSSKEVLRPDATSPNINVFYSALKKKSIPFSTLKPATESATLVVHLANGGYAYLNFNRDVNMQVDLLSLILKRISIENPQKKLRYVDLRHEKAVVKF